MWSVATSARRQQRAAASLAYVYQPLGDAVVGEAESVLLGMAERLTRVTTSLTQPFGAIGPRWSPP